MANARKRYSDTRGLFADSPELLANRRAKKPSDDLVVIGSLAELVNETEAGLTERVAGASSASWQAIAEALASTVTDSAARTTIHPDDTGRSLRNQRETRW